MKTVLIWIAKEGACIQGVPTDMRNKDGVLVDEFDCLDPAS